jgi:hypothetical protein
MASEPNPPTPNEGDVHPMRVAGLGIQFAAALIGFGYLGQWLDRRFNSAPIFLMIGVFLGGGGTFYLSYRRLMAPRPPK